MSIASDVRDAVVSALQTELPSYTVDKFVIPYYRKEQLADAPRIICRVGNREISTNQGPDSCNIMIDVGVVGAGPDGSKVAEGTTFTEAEIDRIDTYDALIETLIALWSDGGNLRSEEMNNHRFHQIQQKIHFDAAWLRQEGVYLSLFQLTYRP